MIELTRLNHTEVVVNASHIVTVEETPDTKLTLLSGEILMVREEPGEVKDLVIRYLRRVGFVPMVVRPVQDAGEAG